MPMMSDLYINLLCKITGNDLKAENTNSVIRFQKEKLKELRHEEQHEDGIFKFWIQNIDEFNYDFVTKDELIFSRRIKFEIRDALYQQDGRQHHVQSKIHKALMGIRIDHLVNTKGEIRIETLTTHIEGNSRSSAYKWPLDNIDKMRASQ